jgi:hypothetical protein
MYESEPDWQGNKGLTYWLRDIAKTLGIKVGGKRVRELMDEIQAKLEKRAVNDRWYVARVITRSAQKGVLYENHKN